MATCPADIEDTGRSGTFAGRAKDRAQQCAHDAASLIAEGRTDEARNTLRDALRYLDDMDTARAKR